mmetsp:Transcript_19961/g.50649  ORF Transcript_19961/g.50649 Transcript_19961/m.50649 type:complete len:291 (+) Transcript_19961:3068-3940(+)
MQVRAYTSKSQPPNKQVLSRCRRCCKEGTRQARQGKLRGGGKAAGLRGTVVRACAGLPPTRPQNDAKQQTEPMKKTASPLKTKLAKPNFPAASLHQQAPTPALLPPPQPKQPICTNATSAGLHPSAGGRGCSSRVLGVRPQAVVCVAVAVAVGVRARVALLLGRHARSLGRGRAARSACACARGLQLVRRLADERQQRLGVVVGVVVARDGAVGAVRAVLGQRGQRVREVHERDDRVPQRLGGRHGRGLVPVLVVRTVLVVAVPVAVLRRHGLVAGSAPLLLSQWVQDVE